MNKIKSKLKYYSCIIFPIFTIFLCKYLNDHIDYFQKNNFFNLDNNKIATLISVSATFIGALLTILTIYLAVPKNPQKVAQFKRTHHERIYLSNIVVGLLIYLLSIICWIFFDNTVLSSILFIGGLSNIIVSIYYTFESIKYM